MTANCTCFRFAPAVNNVIWRFLTGRTTDQRSEETALLTDYVVKTTRAVLPDTLANILQVKSGTAFKIMR